MCIKIRLYCFSFLLLFLFVFQLGGNIFADVEIQFSTQKLEKYEMMGANVQNNAPGEIRVRALFKENVLLLKSGKSDLKFDFETKEILWRSVDTNNNLYSEILEFSTVYRRGVSGFPFLVSVNSFQKTGKIKEFKKKETVNDYSLKKWTYVQSDTNKKTDMMVWSVEDTKMVKEIKNILGRLINECGALPSLGDFDIWCNAFLTVGELPMLAKSRSKFLVADFVGMNLENYIVVKELNSRLGLLNSDIHELIREKGFFVVLSRFFDKFSFIVLLFPTVLILLIFFSPAWWPRFISYLSGVRGSKSNAVAEDRNNIRRVYNFVSFLSAHQDIEKEVLEEKRKFIKRHLDESRILRKYFKKKDARILLDVVDNISVDDLDKYNSQIKLIMDRCDKILEKL